MEKAPDNKPIRTKEYDVPSSKYKVVGSLPTRAIILGPSGSGEFIYIHQVLM